MVVEYLTSPQWERHMVEYLTSPLFEQSVVVEYGTGPQLEWHMMVEYLTSTLFKCRTVVEYLTSPQLEWLMVVEYLTSPVLQWHIVLGVEYFRIRVSRILDNLSEFKQSNRLWNARELKRRTVVDYFV